MNREYAIWRWSLVASLSALGLGVFLTGSKPAEARRLADSGTCCVATLDLNSVLENLEERKVRETELQALIAKYQEQLDEIKRLGQQAQDDLKILPEKSKDWEAKREEAVRLGMRLRGEEELAKALVEDKRKRLSLDLFNKINAAAAKYAQGNGFAVVINSDTRVEIPAEAPEQQVQAAMVGRRVFYRADATDISQAVAQAMNTEFQAR